MIRLLSAAAFGATLAWTNIANAQPPEPTVDSWAAGAGLKPRPWGNMPEPPAVGMCVLVAKADHQIKNAILIVSSGDPERDKKVLAETIGEEVPVPAGWGEDRWFRFWVGKVKPEQRSGANPCDKYNG